MATDTPFITIVIIIIMILSNKNNNNNDKNNDNNSNKYYYYSLHPPACLTGLAGFRIYGLAGVQTCMHALHKGEDSSKQAHASMIDHKRSHHLDTLLMLSL